MKLPWKELDQLCKQLLENKNANIKQHANIIMNYV